MNKSASKTEKYEVELGPSIDNLKDALFKGQQILLRVDRGGASYVLYTAEVVSIQWVPTGPSGRRHEVFNIRGYLYHDSDDAKNEANPKKCKFTCCYSVESKLGDLRIMPQFPAWK